MEIGAIYNRFGKESFGIEERLTWEEIMEKYPDQWVGLSDIEWEDTANIGTAVVKYVGLSEYELLKKQDEEGIHCRYTTPDNIFQMGALML